MQEPNENIQTIDRRETPERLRSMTTLMLVFAILNTIELFTVFINPYLFYVLTVATVVLPIILLAMAPRNHKVGIASWLGIAAFIVFVLAIVIAGLSMLHFAGMDINHLSQIMTSGTEAEQSRVISIILQAALPAMVGLFVSWVLRVVSVVFSYISFVSLKNARNLAESSNTQM